MQPRPTTEVTALRWRTAAMRAGAVLGGASLVFGITQLLAFELSGAEVLWRPEVAWLSGALNVLAGPAAVAFWLLVRSPETPLTRYERAVHFALAFTLVFSLGHLYLAGTHNSLVLMLLLMHLLLVSWFAPHRHVRPLLGVAAVSALALVALEFTGALPYSPMLQGNATLAPIFLDWRWVLGDVLLFPAMAAPVVWLTRRTRVAGEARERDLEVAVQERTTALEAHGAALAARLAELEEAHARLQALEAERAAQARALDEARAALERAARQAMLGEVAGAVVHQLAQPLAGVMANAQAAEQLLAQPGGVAEASDAIADVVADVRRAETIIAAMRRLASAQPTGERGSVDLAALCQATARLLGRQAARADVALQPPARSEVVVADEVQLAQALHVLLANAIEAAAGRVQVSLAREAPWVWVHVDDDGPGFSAPAESVLAPWHSEREGGMGIGLALARRVAEAHGGRIEVGEGPLGGARVSLRLPGA